MSDYADSSSHPVEALAPRASVHVGCGELEDSAVGKAFAEGVEVGV